MKDPQPSRRIGAVAKGGDLTAQIFKQLAKVSIADAHGAILRAAFTSFDRMLLEAAAVGELERIQPWLREQLDGLYFYVLAWRPGASPSGAAHEVIERRAGERPS